MSKDNGERIPGGYYIKARKIQESPVMRLAPCAREIWDYLLRMANHKDNSVCKRGQHITSIPKIMDALCWYAGWRKITYKKHECENNMKALRNAGMITTAKTARGVLVTIVNYSYYQNPENYEYRMEYRKENSTNTEPLPNVKQECKRIRNNNIPAEIVRYLNSQLGTSYKENSKSTVSLINGRLSENYTVQDFRTVIDSKILEWGNDPRMKKYLRPDTLFRPSKFESYLQAAKQSNAVDDKLIELLGGESENTRK